MDRASASDNGNGGPARWSLRLFGGFELNELPGGQKAVSLGKRERVLLAYLSLSPNCRTSRRRLVTLLWGDAADDTTLDNLRNCLWGLRKALGDTEHQVIASEGEDIVLDVSAFEVDAWALRGLATQSGRVELEAAATLCSGEFLGALDIDSEEFESWRRAEAARYRDQTVDVHNRLMTQLAECGEAERAIETGLRILRLEPLHEPAVRQLMRLYGESGRRGPAVQLYRVLAEALKTELDAQPEAETRAVFAEIARGGEERTGGPASPAAAAPASQTAPDTAEAKPLHYPPSFTAASDAAPSSLRSRAQQLASVIGAVQNVAALRAKTRALNWMVAGGLAAMMVIFFSYQFAARTTSQQTGIEAAKSAASAAAGAIAIAVLPFVNLSGEADQEFFSDGMTEEITSTLSKIPGLRVVGRTSAFQFKGQNKDLIAIGQALHATHIIEGSVRKDGNEVRITAQLIRSDDGTHLWTESYDRELKGIFAIQEDIAKAIAVSLSVPLGLKAGQTLVSNRMSDTESYQDYLRARALVRAVGPREPGGPLTEAAKLLEKVVARDPNYAPAWGLLAQAYAVIPGFTASRFNGTTDEVPLIGADSLQKVEAAAQQAIRLDPNGIDGYTAQARTRYAHHLFAETEDLYKRALSLDPGNPEALQPYSNMLGVLGRLKDSLVLSLRLQAQEPLVPIFNGATAAILFENGRTDEAIAIWKTTPGPGPLTNLAEAYASMGRYGEAVEVLQKIPAGTASPGVLEEAIRLLRTAPAQTASPQQNALSHTAFGFVYLFVGTPDRALDFYEGLADAGFYRVTESKLWAPDYAPVRKTERFKAHVRKAGLVDYWKARGWPDLCHPTTGDDFACD
jgi:TolB-like protein/DNA-binding SARP family transcriptional activator